MQFISKPTSPKDEYSTPIYVNATGDALRGHALWGDRVVALGTIKHGRAHVRVRGHEGWIGEERIGDEALLELYVVDVGNGDGLMLVTPDGRHILIDGGWPRRRQPTRKNAADFVDWKFAKEYGLDHIALDAMICTHNDADHYGGLWDLLDPRQGKELDVSSKRVSVEAFYHAGLSWWKDGKDRTLGPFVESNSGPMFTRLLGDRASVEQALEAEPRLQGDWAKFMHRVAEARTKDGSPTPIERLSHATMYLPGFGPEQSEAVIHVLGPVEFEVDGAPAIRKFDSDESKNTNGNSVLMRVDYRHARLLLTGDLNKSSQHHLLGDHADHGVFEVDVAKCCHHGSRDVSMRFLHAMKPAVTVISSGDSEGHDHPRPSIVAASAITGFQTMDEDGDELMTPLIYCTELARSVGIGIPTELRVKPEGQAQQVLTTSDFDEIELVFKKTNAGDLNPSTKVLSFAGINVVAGLVYGLINVRTDGETILCAALNEKDGTWNVHTIKARF